MTILEINSHIILSTAFWVGSKGQRRRDRGENMAEKKTEVEEEEGKRR